MTTTKKLTTEDYRMALELAGIDAGQIHGCDATDWGWLICLYTPGAVWYKLFPDGGYTPQ